MTQPTQPPSAQRQALVSVTGVPGYFAQGKGRDMTSAITKVWDGGASKPQNVAAPRMMGDYTVTRPYYSEQHRELVKSFRAGVGSLLATVTVVDTDANGDVIGEQATYPNSLLSACNWPDTDAASGAGADWVMIFALGEEV